VTELQGLLIALATKILSIADVVRANELFFRMQNIVPAVLASLEEKGGIMLMPQVK
jgi:hypothetical protein